MSGKAVRETLGFLGVIVSLVFVGLEVRQNSLSVQAATYQELISKIASLNLSTAIENCTGLAIENVTLGGGDEPLDRRFLLCSCPLSSRG